MLYLLVLRELAPKTMLQDLAGSADLFLQGVLCSQFAHYTDVNDNDSWLMKLFVAGLAMLTTLKTVQILLLSSGHEVCSLLNPFQILSLNAYIVSITMTMFGFAIAAAGVSTYVYTDI
ncbi:hypothetical protein DFH08DRAFT_823662 [Mycena albidolilacea]|uniref:Uncharacterized protein n=1 Tax=Mycena albidolilacea TaxID=1033008 RepID=A0AAD6Z6I1_9AGAR|nr:hypothetical protein DFH08DRAFT_823662 [Mycena albidolilacea]